MEVDPRCPQTEDGVAAIATILSITDPKTRQDHTVRLMGRRDWSQLVCDFRAAEEKVLSGNSSQNAILPEIKDTAREAGVQLLTQAMQVCGKCPQAALLQTVAAANAVNARMYPEALRILFDLLESRSDLRPVYESVQKTFAATQRGKGEVTLGAPR